MMFLVSVCVLLLQARAFQIERQRPALLSIPTVTYKSTSVLLSSVDNSPSVSDVSSEMALFGMGCFWNPQTELKNLHGVVDATTGYAPLNEEINDARSRPASYFSVSSGDGRVEAVLVEYDPSSISYSQLLQSFWQYHDASEVAKTQYQSAIWPLSKEQKEIAIQDLERASDAYQQGGLRPPKTMIADTDASVQWLDNNFVKAESIHQDFWKKLRIKTVLLALLVLCSESGVQLDLTVIKLTSQMVAGWILLEVGLQLVFVVVCESGFALEKK
jgi:peptide-methionine (S)-S-oxide reductase